jgi:sphingomyelin phosphodiesterase
MFKRVYSVVGLLSAVLLMATPGVRGYEFLRTAVNSLDENVPANTNVKDFLKCQLCKVSVAEFDAWFEGRSTEDMLEGIAEKICLRYVVDLQKVCQGAVKEMGDIIIPVLSQSIFSPDYFCGEFLGYCTDENYYVFYAEDWVNQLLKTKPAAIKDNNYVNKIYDQIKADTKPRRTLKAVQISDPHVDYEYAVGADAFCGNFICCRADDGFPTDPTRQAGPFGAYNCDIPPAGLESML